MWLSPGKASSTSWESGGGGMSGGFGSSAQDTPKLGMGCGLPLVGTADTCKPNKSLRLGQTLRVLSPDGEKNCCVDRGQLNRDPRTVRAHSSHSGL